MNTTISHTLKAATALAVVTLLSSPVTQAYAATPLKDWHVSPVMPQADHLSPYCALAARYADGLIVTFARNLSDKGTLAFEFPTGNFIKGENYKVDLFPGTSAQQSFAAYASSPNLLIIKTGQGSNLYDRLAQGDNFTLSLDNASVQYVLEGEEKAFFELNHCLKGLSPSATEESASRKSPRLKSGYISEKKRLYEPEAPREDLAMDQRTSDLKDMLNKAREMARQGRKDDEGPYQETDLPKQEKTEPLIVAQAPISQPTSPVDAKEPVLEQTTEDITIEEDVTSDETWLDQPQEDTPVFVKKPVVMSNLSEPVTETGKLKPAMKGMNTRITPPKTASAEKIKPVRKESPLTLGRIKRSEEKFEQKKQPPLKHAVPEEAPLETAAVSNVHKTVPPIDFSQSPDLVQEAIQEPPITDEKEAWDLSTEQVQEEPGLLTETQKGTKEDIAEPVAVASVEQPKPPIHFPNERKIISDWFLDVSKQDGNDITPYCSLSAQYEDGNRLIVTRAANGSGSIGLNMAVNLLERGRLYDINVKVGRLFDHVIRARAASENMLIIQIGSNSDSFYEAMRLEEALLLAMPAMELSFDVSGVKEKLEGFQTCLGAL